MGVQEQLQPVKCPSETSGTNLTKAGLAIHTQGETPGAGTLDGSFPDRAEMRAAPVLKRTLVDACKTKENDTQIPHLPACGCSRTNKRRTPFFFTFCFGALYISFKMTLIKVHFNF